MQQHGGDGQLGRGVEDEQPRCHGNSEQDEDIAQPGEDVGKGMPKTPPIVDEVRAREVAALLAHEPTARKDQTLLALFDGAEQEQDRFVAFFRCRGCVQLIPIHLLC